MGWNYLSIPKLQWCNRWSLGMDTQFHPTIYCVCDYLSTPGFKDVSRRGHCSALNHGLDHCWLLTSKNWRMLADSQRLCDSGPTWHVYRQSCRRINFSKQHPGDHLMSTGRTSIISCCVSWRIEESFLKLSQLYCICHTMHVVSCENYITWVYDS